MTLLLVAVVGWFLAAFVAWTWCRAAAIADRQAERGRESNGDDNTMEVAA